MRFLVRIDTVVPLDLAPQERERLFTAESARGRQLVAAGTIEHIFRVPGGLSNVGIWQARGADELHEALTSLPLAPFQKVEVTALATHPLTPPPSAN